ncbi:MAG TPA: TonB family protein [Polyangiaceae bacterium]|nr:TonB family protein [Polyangiaceae bacterium]
MALAVATLSAIAAAQQGAVPPRIKEEAEAVYPDAARGLERDVLLVVTIDAEGRVTDAQLAEPTGDALDDVALDMVRRYEFFPATRDGKPIKSRIKMKLSLHGPPRERLDAGAGESDAAAPADAGATQTARVDASADAGAPPPPVPEVEDVHVRGERTHESPTVRTLDRTEIESMPGGAGDALRPIESLPGVSRAPAFSGLIILRGSAPQDSQVFIDRAAVPLAFHFGGLAAVVPTELIDHVDVYPGNYDVQYGRGNGGIVDIGLRSPARDRIHAVAKFDLIDGSALAEGPIFDDKTRFLVAARRSWIEAYFPWVAQELSLGVTASPVYYDYQAMLERDLGKRTTLRLTFLGSNDSVNVYLPPSQSSDPAFSGQIQNQTDFWRLQLQADAKLKGGAKLFSQLSVGQDHLFLNLGSTLNADSTATRVQGRAQGELPISKAVRLIGGLDLEGGQWDYTLKFPAIPSEASPDTGPLFGQKKLTSVRSLGYFDPAAFANLEVFPVKRLRVLVGGRVDTFGATEGVYVQPRMNLRYVLRDGDDKTTLKAALGLYAQPPQVNETDPIFGTPGLRANQATQVSVGIEQEALRHLEISVEPFYKRLFDLVTQRPDASQPSGFRYDNEGTGFAYGAEFLIKYKPDRHFSGWIAYTISRSERRDLPELPLRLFEYDQTHVLSALGTYRFGTGWSVGARVRYVTGNPYTPILGGYFDADAGDYGPVDKLPVYSGRLPAFFSMDVRVEKQWRLFKDSTLQVYLDVLNATNNRNVESFTYQYDYQVHATAAGLPILPALGARLTL